MSTSELPAGVDIRSYALGAEYGAIVARMEMNFITDHGGIEVVIDPSNLFAIDAAAESMGWVCESTPTGIFNKMHLRLWREPGGVADCQGEDLVSTQGSAAFGLSGSGGGSHLRVVK